MMAAAVAAMTLGELLGQAAGAHAGLAVSDLISDSREVSPGAAFVALAGERSHGLDYAEQALAAGAAIILYEASAEISDPPSPSIAVPDLGVRLGQLAASFYGSAEPSDELIGVTGTNGKTTVSWLIAQSLAGLGRPCAYLGTLGHGMPGALEPQSLTTPDCLSLHRTLAGLGTPNATVEVSSHALAQDRVAGLEFTIGAFTNISRDHLDWHRTMDAYFDAKARLFESGGLRAAVINSDDSYAEVLLGRLPATTTAITVSLGRSAATLTGSLQAHSLRGVELEVADKSSSALLSSPLIGAFNAENLLVSLGVLVAAGIDLDAAAVALGQVSPPPGRMEVFGGAGAAPRVVVDYAHTPRALERVLTALTTVDSGAITCVFGCGGERDRGKRALMGQMAARHAAHIVLTDDNPRSEDPVAIIADIKSGISRHPDLRVLHDRERAIIEAIAAARPGDVVLIAGKGHERAQLIGGEARTFDDRAVVVNVLEGTS